MRISGVERLMHSVLEADAAITVALPPGSGQHEQLQILIVADFHGDFARRPALGRQSLIASP
ncbi:hypothetical protein [Bradyrhizobium sp. CCGUVB23]|uniref:hypothetical protein n=1 Tax=Bradyrhizobium sp. CCGUVB23 TaxID=2949630 RepID=UPI0020B3A62F|nr:hypothetical protein [Bradyrhizobium sp. CCGUVB23]MCP3466604.1 hypothetical protein [Bradyrhizobium sp. CCGUVB23]